MRTELTRAQRDVVVERYRRGHAILQAIKLLSDARLGKAHGISASSVRRIEARGFKYAKCTRAHQDVPIEVIKELCSGINERARLQKLYDLDSLEAIAEHLGTTEKHVFSIAHYASRKAPKVKALGFLFMPAVNPGVSLGYYGHG